MEPLWKVYADELKHHFPVHAFYNPEPSSEISPGTIGYIDGSGNWHMLERIPGTHPGSNIQDEGVQWGERWSNSIHKIAVHANAKYVTVFGRVEVYADSQEQCDCTNTFTSWI